MSVPGPVPNKGMELTAYSVRSYLAPASSSSSCLAFGGLSRMQGRSDPMLKE